MNKSSSTVSATESYTFNTSLWWYILQSIFISSLKIRPSSCPSDLCGMGVREGLGGGGWGGGEGAGLLPMAWGRRRGGGGGGGCGPYLCLIPTLSSRRHNTDHILLPLFLLHIRIHIPAVIGDRFYGLGHEYHLKHVLVRGFACRGSSVGRATN